jgi:hypothetical protein
LSDFILILRVFVGFYPYMEGDQGLADGSLVGVQVAAGQQVVGQVSLLVASPGLEGGDELDLVDQAVLQREPSEEQVALGGDRAGL